MEDVHNDVRVMLNRMIRNFHNEMNKEQAERDRKTKNYGSRIFEHGMRWRYWELKPAGRKHKMVRFCYTTTANATGCYLTFTETITGKRKMTVKRERIFPHDTRREAKAWARREFEKSKTA